ncbi:hypothetical protein, conserved [Trypanosoma brucei gambiense DAL972]|uniref:Uncharacterized protein n=1 Tax=Trypanosoma brucei gambiense (strain MHOM/CI/86/DAL972) TaxID=679716 RepID=D0A8P9_TRYB9|nr:hypothetical protein, conserved [Trypanosoma brucei gambiense DAL972]CBH18050.1 hypothetical protein, conserved [Trypanosoma brucei gambiense DAL972]|eukprot:XP_011780314.1 hypothetical protein, conserved [Trypanosoma brucei gambiense DAL972]
MRNDKSMPHTANPSPIPPSNGGTICSDHKSLELFNAAHPNPTGQQIEVAPIAFLTTNRVVSALKKAIGRLELLNLLDTTAPDDGYNASPFVTEQRTTNSLFAKEAKSTTADTVPRKAALIAGLGGETSHREIREINHALQVAATKQRTVRPTVGDLVQEQQALEQKYGELLQKVGRVNPSRSGPTLDPSCFASVQDLDKLALIEELKQTSKRLREHNKALFTRLKDNPNDSDNWKKVGNERLELIELLKSVIKELTVGYASGRTQSARTGLLARRYSRGPRLSGTNDSSGTEAREPTLSTAMNRFGSSVQLKRAGRNPSAARIPLTSTFEKFAKLVSDEQSAQLWASELVLKEKELNQNVKQLQQELKTQKLLREKEVTELKLRVAELRQKLRQEKKLTKQRGDMVRAAAEAAHEAMQRAADDKAHIVLDGMQANRATDVMEERAHAAFKEHLLERTAAMDDLAMQWDRKNQNEVKRAEARKIDLEQMRQQCAERLEKARKDKEVELEKKAERDAEKEKLEAAKVAEELRRNTVYEAVSKIQSAIRAMFTRKAVAVLRKKASKHKRKT